MKVLVSDVSPIFGNRFFLWNYSILHQKTLKLYLANFTHNVYNLN